MARARKGFTILELMVVVAIIGITAAFAVPSWRQIQSDSRLRGVARDVSNAFSTARSNAIVNERPHIVYFGIGPATDICGNNLVDGAGNAVPILILDDQDGDCCIDVGETTITQSATPGVFWGSTFAGAPPADDSGLGAFATGASLADQFGVQARWVAFRPDGVPVGFTNGCVLGQTGSGKGGIYITNAPPFSNRDYAIVLSPLGSAKVYGFDRAAGAWTD